MLPQELRSSHNARFRIVFHLVLVTKYRKKVLTRPIIERAAEILRYLALAWEGSVLECSGEADHLHVLFEIPPKARPSDVVNNYKTVTSRRLRSEFSQLKAAYRGKPVLWSPSYCILSAGGAPIEILRQYVQNQTLPP